MNYEKIDTYMDEHDFLPADRYKVKSFIENQNRRYSKNNKYVNGYLTRTTLFLFTEYGAKTAVSRLFLGIQENFK